MCERVYVYVQVCDIHCVNERVTREYLKAVVLIINTTMSDTQMILLPYGLIIAFPFQSSILSGCPLT